MGCAETIVTEVGPPKRPHMAGVGGPTDQLRPADRRRSRR